MRNITAVAWILAGALALCAEGAVAETATGDEAQGPLMIRTFVLEHAETRDVERLLRSLVDVQYLSAQPQLEAIVIRATAAQMAAVERLIAVVDQPRGEIDVGVELLRLNRQAGATGANLRLSAAEFLSLRGADSAKSLAHSTVSVMEAGSGRLHLEFGKPRAPLIRFDLTLRVRQHPAAEEITLDVTGELLHLDTPDPDGNRAPVAWNEIESTLRLALGETAVLRFPDTDPGNELVIALTPAVVRASGLDAQSLQALREDTEAPPGPKG